MRHEQRTFSLADQHGFDWCLNKLEYYQETLGERFRPAWLLNKLVAANMHDYSTIIKTPQAVR